jgi:hypothetical protein
MSNGNGNKKIMRGPVWSLILFVCAFTLISVTISAIQGSAGGNVLAAIPLTILYIAAYFVLPRVVRPREQAVQPIENTPLAIPAQLTIIRDNSFAGVAIPTIVTLNGAVAANQRCRLKKCSYCSRNHRWCKRGASCKGRRFPAENLALGIAHKQQSHIRQTRSIKD